MVKVMKDPNTVEKGGANKTSSWAQSKMSTEELLSLPIDDLLVRLNTSQSGLTSQEVENRLKIYGHNEFVKRKKRTAIVEFLFHISNPLVIILLIAALISGFLEEIIEAIIIFSIVLLSVVLDVFQESKGEKAAEMLKEKVTITTTVLRDGVKQEIKFSEIVPGDIVYLSAGDIVPADARVINAKDLFVDQSALTGESFPVEKAAAPLKTKSAIITEWDNCLFLGTSVVSGTAAAVVVRTGKFTGYGQIAQRLVTREPETEYERGLRRFGFLMMEVTFVLVLFVFFINALFKRGVLESLLFAVATVLIRVLTFWVRLSVGGLVVQLLGTKSLMPSMESLG